MSGRHVCLRVAGQSYKVVSSASEEDLQRFAEVVSAKVEELSPHGRPPHPQSILLAAITLAHELEEERTRRIATEDRARELFGRVLQQIDALALDSPEDTPSNAQNAQRVIAS